MRDEKGIYEKIVLSSPKSNSLTTSPCNSIEKDETENI
jgi:hypothetical protein